MSLADVSLRGFAEAVDSNADGKASVEEAVIWLDKNEPEAFSGVKVRSV